MKRIKLKTWLIIGAGAIIVLALFFFFMNRATMSPSVSKTKGVQLTQNSAGQYQTVIKDGHYLTSAARGLTATSQGNQVDTKDFESGLLNLAKNHFKTGRYIFQEGQYLSSDTVNGLLSRQTDSNLTALNPKDNGKTDSSREPIYVQSLTEQDFMTKEGSNLKLAGMVVGVAMNTQDVYQKEQYGANYYQSISEEARIAYGKKIAPKLIKQIRAQTGVAKNIPIVIAMYANAPEDSLGGGAFYSEATSKSGTNISAWTNIDDKTVVFPKESSDSSSVGNDENTGFTNFKNDIANFFPNIAGATAIGHFTNSKLTSMKATVTTQFYSQTEIEAFANYVASAAVKFLPSSAPVQITIKTANETQVILNRKSDEKSYTMIYM
ncbi:CamS family sex pheromone protein [Fructobacillus sp. M1-13]|uniref:CamS family sex pheromone protein n=1 Tax=Fructobacillus papyriferae TaxID=2713171 RepID=A0ABS5QQ44_9LACO|nr:CamS family sex pheromone protein [Fructobacillus papyriferae]MBS9334952.1 CamS family sex pheromone protein [Fructobacillus papyriferae]MCD2159564.1 CamS family sex pheromone protein [Fructobacillus papyriferae]